MIDFTLIPNGEDFELFCRDLLAGLGITILQGPSRGPDGKKDLIIQLETENLFGKKEIDKYLVQCKHRAISNKSIYEKELGDIRSACTKFNVNGYLLITSTIASTTVQENFQAMQNEGLIKTYIMDRKLIEKYLMKCKNPLEIMQRYDLLKTHEIIDYHAIIKQESEILKKIFTELQREIEITDNFDEFLDLTNTQNIIYAYKGIIYGICIRNMKLGDSLNYLSKLSYLEYIKIYKTDLTEIPESFYDLGNIDYLDLTNNKIKIISSSFNKLEKLSVFVIYYNPIDKFAAPSHSFKNLNQFHCDSSQLKSIKPWFSLFAKEIEIDFEIIDVDLNINYFIINQKKLCIEDIGEFIVDLVVNAGIDSFNAFKNASINDLEKIKGIGNIDFQKFKDRFVKYEQDRIVILDKLDKSLFSKMMKN